MIMFDFAVIRFCVVIQVNGDYGKIYSKDLWQIFSYSMCKAIT